MRFEKGDFLQNLLTNMRLAYKINLACLAMRV